MVLLVTVLIIINVALGVLLTYQAASSMKTQIKERMLDISNSAASLLDGNILKEVTPEDKGAPGYERIMNTLRSFRENIDLEYIYCINDDGNKHFSFGLDPTPDDPGEFGSPVVYTDAQLFLHNEVIG